VSYSAVSWIDPLLDQSIVSIGVQHACVAAIAAELPLPIVAVPMLWYPPLQVVEDYRRRHLQTSVAPRQARRSFTARAIRTELRRSVRVASFHVLCLNYLIAAEREAYAILHTITHAWA